YQLTPELDDATEMDMNDEYLIDSLKWSDDELEFKNSDYEAYDPEYGYNFHIDYGKCWGIPTSKKKYPGSTL
ncbi:18446_t:CDS:1, partial [Racocetra persica]